MLRKSILSLLLASSYSLQAMQLAENRQGGLDILKTAEFSYEKNSNGIGLHVVGKNIFVTENGAKIIPVNSSEWLLNEQCSSSPFDSAYSPKFEGYFTLVRSYGGLGLEFWPQDGEPIELNVCISRTGATDILYFSPTLFLNKSESQLYVVIPPDKDYSTIDGKKRSLAIAVFSIVNEEHVSADYPTPDGEDSCRCCCQIC